MVTNNLFEINNLIKNNTGGTIMMIEIMERLKLWSEFKKEKSLVSIVLESEIPFQNTYCWDRIEDIPSMKNSRTIYFEKHRDNTLIAAPFNKDGIDYWKLYIVNGKKIQRVYLEKRMLQPKNCNHNRQLN